MALAKLQCATPISNWHGIEESRVVTASTWSTTTSLQTAQSTFCKYCLWKKNVTLVRFFFKKTILWTVHIDGTWEDASSSAIIASLCTIPGGGRGRPGRPGSRGGCVGRDDDGRCCCSLVVVFFFKMRAHTYRRASCSPAPPASPAFPLPSLCSPWRRGMTTAAAAGRCSRRGRTVHAWYRNLSLNKNRLCSKTCGIDNKI